MNLNGIAILRCSSKPQLEKYGPAAQMRDIEEGIAHFSKGPVQISKTIQIQEPASGWNRTKWEAAMDECLSEHREGRVQIIVFPRVDRETRFLAGSFSKLLEVVKSGMFVYFAQEKLLLDRDDADTFEEYQRQALEAQAYIRVMKRNTTRGRMEAARQGQIPSGFGRYGYFGLAYDKSEKVFIPIPGKIEIAEEILHRVLAGEGSSMIVKDLQRRGVTGAGGGLLHRSAVSRVMANARVYAGIITWNGIEFKDKVRELIITEEQADLILHQLKRNKERSYGADRRTWLGRKVFCAMCGNRYILDSKKGCRCNRNDSRVPNRCESPKICFLELSTLAYGEMIKAISEPESVIESTKKACEQWEREKQHLEVLQRQKQQRQVERDKRRRRLNTLYEFGGCTDEEYKERLQSIREEEAQEEKLNLDTFLKSEPPTVEQVLKAYNRLKTITLLCEHWSEVDKNPQDKYAAKLAEEVGLTVYIGPSDDDGLRFEALVLLNLPIRDEEGIFTDEENPIARVAQSSMVSQSSSSVDLSFGNYPVK